MQYNADVDAEIEKLREGIDMVDGEEDGLTNCSKSFYHMFLLSRTIIKHMINPERQCGFDDLIPKLDAYMSMYEIQEEIYYRYQLMDGIKCMLITCAIIKSISSVIRFCKQHGFKPTKCGQYPYYSCLIVDGMFNPYDINRVTSVIMLTQELKAEGSYDELINNCPKTALKIRTYNAITMSVITLIGLHKTSTIMKERRDVLKLIAKCVHDWRLYDCYYGKWSGDVTKE